MTKKYLTFLVPRALLLIALIIVERSRDREPPAMSLLGSVTVEYSVKCGVVFWMWEQALLEHDREYQARIFARKAEVLDVEAAALYGLGAAQSKAQAYANMLVQEAERVKHAEFIFEMVGACEGYYGDRPPRIL